MLKIEKKLSLLDEILESYQEQIGKNFLGYKNHNYRVLHFCFALKDFNEEDKNKMMIAAAFHDIAFFTKGTVDYLPPSIEIAKEYLSQNNKEDQIEEISLIIDQHHKLTQYKGPFENTVETFRQADLADFSIGFMKGDLTSDTVKNVKKAFPNEGFHQALMKGGAGWVMKNPFNPIPILKW